jgi:hypothetical protein
MRARGVLIGSVAVAAIGGALNGCGGRPLVDGNPGSAGTRGSTTAGGTTGTAGVGRGGAPGRGGASGSGGAAGGGSTAGRGGSIGATLELPDCLRALLCACAPEGKCVEEASGPDASNVCFETGVRASLGYMAGSGSCPHGDLYVHVPKANGTLCYRYEAYTATSTACEVTQHTWKDAAGNVVASGTSSSSLSGRITQITCATTGVTASCGEPVSVSPADSCCGVSRFGTAACTAGVPNALCTSGSCPGTGGASGGGGVACGGNTGMGGSTGGFGEPACASSVLRSQPCGPADQQLCFKRCGPEDIGVKKVTCQATPASPGATVYVEMSGCTFDSIADYSCYKIPTAASSACPAGVTPMGSMTCGTVPHCVLCNSIGGLPGGLYLDSTGSAKVGYCVCQPPNAAGLRTWSCASDTSWPCPTGSGC